MQILFLGLTPPFPTTNGQRLRNLAILRALAAEGHETTWISFCEPEQISAATRELNVLCKAVDLIPMPGCEAAGLRDVWSRLRSVFSRMPHGVRRFRSPALQERVARWLATRQFQVIVCDDSYLFANLPAVHSTPVLLNKHDLTHVIFRRYAKVQRNPLKRVYALLEYLKVRRWERLTCSSSEVVLAASPTDRMLVSSMAPGRSVVVVPNAIDCSDYRVPDQRLSPTVDLIYFGSMDFYPNQDAVQFLISRIFPIIRLRIPEVTLAIVGRNMPQHISDQLRNMPGVHGINGVPDMRDMIAASAVCLVPLRIGSGTRLKILEAAAMGKPVVSTTIGAEGLDFVHGEDILIADKPGDFAACVVSMLHDANYRQSIGTGARRRVELEYSVPVVRRRLAEALEIASTSSFPQNNSELRSAVV